MFENYKDSLFKNNTKLRAQLRFKSNLHNVYTEEVNNIELNSNDDERLQKFHRVILYPYRANAFKVGESEMMAVKNTAASKTFAFTLK